MNNRQNNRFMVQAAAGILMLAAALWALRRGANDGVQPLGGNFAYDIDNFRRVDPALIVGREVGGWPVGMAALHALCVGPDGRIYVAGDSRIQVFATNGVPEVSYVLPGTPRCVTVAEDGRIFAGVGNRVTTWAPGGGPTSQWDAVSNGVFTAIAVHDSGVFVADAGQRALWRYDREGHRLGAIGPLRMDGSPHEFVIPSPYFDLDIAPDGGLWAVDPGRHEMRNYRTDGTVATSWNKSAMSVDGFCGCCNPSYIAIRADGSFVTSEKGIPRIKIYSAGGDFVGVVAPPSSFGPDTRGLDVAVDAGGRILVLDPERRAVRIFEVTPKPVVGGPAGK